MIETAQAVSIEAPDEDTSLVQTPTPAPTATPGIITDLVERAISSSALSRKSFLSLGLEDWANLGISVLIVFLSLLVLARLLTAGLERLARRTPSKYDEEYLQAIRPQIRLFVLVLSLNWATMRLLFLKPASKQWLGQIYFTANVLVVGVMAWKLVNYVVMWYRDLAEKSSDVDTNEAAIQLGQRVAHAMVIIIGLILVLDNFGINISALVAALGIGGLALSLGAQDTLSNMISGVMILMDRPFRVGDRIEIQGLDTWGDVIEIGLRSTRIRTLDNRLVIVPNSSISSNQIVNYTYPDPRYRVQIEIGVAYGVDLKEVRQLIIQAVHDIEGILTDKPIDVLFLEFGDSAMILRVRWWISSYIDTRRMFDKVNEAIYLSLEGAGVEMPPQTFAVEIKPGREEAKKGSGE